MTTVAALGWVSFSGVGFGRGPWKSLTIWSLGVSVLFAILTLALVPLVAEKLTDTEVTIYRVKVEYRVPGVGRVDPYLTTMCRPQHVFFMGGIVFCCIGTATVWWTPLLVVGAAVTLMVATTIEKNRAARNRMTAQYQPQQVVYPAAPDIADQIRKLASLRDDGVLTEEEFQAKKAALLA